MSDDLTSAPPRCRTCNHERVDGPRCDYCGTVVHESDTDEGRAAAQVDPGGKHDAWPEERSWHKGATEPDGVKRVSDIDGDEWGKANGKWRHPHAGPSRSWANLLDAYGPLTEVITR